MNNPSSPYRTRPEPLRNPKSLRSPKFLRSPKSLRNPKSLRSVLREYPKLDRTLATAHMIEVFCYVPNIWWSGFSGENISEMVNLELQLQQRGDQKLKENLRNPVLIDLPKNKGSPYRFTAWKQYGVLQQIFDVLDTGLRRLYWDEVMGQGVPHEIPNLGCVPVLQEETIHILCQSEQYFKNYHGTFELLDVGVE